jgi:hypothetical protein
VLLNGGHLSSLAGFSVPGSLEKKKAEEDVTFA